MHVRPEPALVARQCWVLLFLTTATSALAQAPSALAPADPAAPAARSPGEGAGTNPGRNPGRNPGKAFVELLAPAQSFFVQQPIRLRLRFGVEKGFLKKNILQPFHQPLDVPLHLQASWLDGLPAAKALAPRPAGAGGKSFVLSGSLARASASDEVIEGDSFVVVELQREFLPLRPGPLTFAAPQLRFAYATQFKEDFINGRIGVDRRDATVPGQKLTLRILPLPVAGRPSGFGGAVGHFKVRAEATPSALQVGQILKLALHVEGDGNLEFFDPPALVGFENFHVYGKIDTKSRTRRTVTYDLTPLRADVESVPPIRLVYFEPGPKAGYRTATSQPIPLQVRPLPPGETLDILTKDVARRPKPGINDIFGLKSVAAAGPASPLRLSPWLLATLLLLPWLLLFGLRSWLRARSRHRSDPLRARARGAGAAFRAGLGEASRDPAESFIEFLAAHLHCSSAAVIAPDLSARLERLGVAPELAQRSARLLESILAERYGGGTSPEGTDAVRSVVAELERALR